MGLFLVPSSYAGRAGRAEPVFPRSCVIAVAAQGAEAYELVPPLEPGEWIATSFISTSAKVEKIFATNRRVISWNSFSNRITQSVPLQNIPSQIAMTESAKWWLHRAAEGGILEISQILRSGSAIRLERRGSQPVVDFQVHPFLNRILQVSNHPGEPLIREIDLDAPEARTFLEPATEAAHRWIANAKYLGTGQYASMVFGDGKQETEARVYDMVDPTCLEFTVFLPPFDLKRGAPHIHSSLRGQYLAYSSFLSPLESERADPVLEVEIFPLPNHPDSLPRGVRVLHLEYEDLSPQIPTAPSDAGVVMKFTANHRLLIGDPFGNIEMWNLADGKQQDAFKAGELLWTFANVHPHQSSGKPSRVRALALSPREDRFASGGEDGSVRVIEMNAPYESVEVNTLIPNLGGRVIDLEFMNDANQTLLVSVETPGAAPGSPKPVKFFRLPTKR